MAINKELFTPQVISLLLLHAYAGMMLSMVGVTSPFVVETFQLDEKMVAYMFAIASLSGLFTMKVLQIADRQGRKGLLFKACLTCYICTFSIAFTSDFLIFISLVVIIGSSAGVMSTLCVVMVYESLPVHLRHKGQTYLGLCRAIGGGGALGFVAIFSWADEPWRWVWGICCYPLLLHFIFKKFINESSTTLAQKKPDKRAKKVWQVLLSNEYRRNSLLLILYVVLWTISSAAVAQWTYYHCYTNLKLSEFEITLLLGVVGLTSFTGFFWGEAAVRRIGMKKTLSIFGLGSALASIVFYSVPNTSSVFLILTIAIAIFFETALVNAALNIQKSLVNSLYKEDMRASTHGILLFFASLSAILSQLIFASIIEALETILAVIITLSIFKFLACIVVLFIKSNDSKAVHSQGLIWNLKQ